MINNISLCNWMFAEAAFIIRMKIIIIKSSLDSVCLEILIVEKYSKTSLNRPPAGENTCGPFREVVDLQNFPKYREYTVNFGIVKSRSI